ncbi:MAG: ABC transporter permease [Halodesulfurarchaeum sp.]
MTRLRRLGLLLGPFVLLGVGWELAARAHLINPAFFPPPSTVLALAVELYVHDDFLAHALASVRRILLAGLLGGGLGIWAGFVLGRSERWRVIVDPHLSLLYPLPKIALLPVMFSLFGVTETARILTMALAVVVLVTINTMGAVRQIDPTFLEAARDNGATGWALYREVILPATLPQVASGLSLGFGVAVVLLVVIEMVAADAGLGYVIWTSWQQFTIPRLYVALFSINVLGVLFVHGPEEIGETLTPWTEA